MREFIPEYLEVYFDEIDPMEFYRSIFPAGELQVKGKFIQGMYNAIAVELMPKAEQGMNARRHIITDDLMVVDELLDSENFIIISPISYAGKSRTSQNARFIYAIAIDLDGITEPQYLRDLFFQMKNGFLPTPTYTVFSGSGVHLYYQLEKAVPCYKNVVKQMSELKRALTRKIWNRYTTELFDKIQQESLFQGFRMVGGITKDGKRTRAFITGDPVSIDYLNGFVEKPAQMTEYTYKSKLTLAEAREKYPEWYERRVVENMPRGAWTTNRAVFDWWIEKIKNGVAVGHRYFCIMTLAIYAKKAGISKEELEQVAFSFVEPFNMLTTDPNNRFTREDVLSALEMYNDDYIRFPIDSIVNLTNIPIEKNKRNHREQKVHLKLARDRKRSLKEIGEMKPEGRPRTNKYKIVIEWRKNNPNGSKYRCMRETGLSQKTVYRYWDINE